MALYSVHVDVKLQNRKYNDNNESQERKSVNMTEQKIACDKNAMNVFRQVLVRRNE